MRRLGDRVTRRVATPLGWYYPGGVGYLWRMPFNAADQVFANGQIVDTTAEGAEAGSRLTIVATDATGVAEIESNRLKFSGKATDGYTGLGAYGPDGIARALGRGLLATVECATNIIGLGIGWHDAAAIGDTTTYEAALSFHVTAGRLLCRADTPASFGIRAATYAASTEYEIALVLGGFDVNGVPYRRGETAANYLYGAAFFIKGGTYTDWMLIVRNYGGNDGTLYPSLNLWRSGVNAAYVDSPRVPDYDLSGALQPGNMSTFDGPNGTSLDAIVPELGGAWTENAGVWEIQGNVVTTVNQAANQNYRISTVESGASDVVAMVMSAMTGSTSYEYGIVLRYTDSNNYWMVCLDEQNNLFRIIEMNGGAPTVRASAGVAIAVGTFYHITAVADGQSITGLLNGVNSITYGAAALNEAVTRHGVIGGTVVGTADTEHDNFAIFPRTSSNYSILGRV